MRKTLIVVGIVLGVLLLGVGIVLSLPAAQPTVKFSYPGKSGPAVFLDDRIVNINQEYRISRGEHHYSVASEGHPQSGDFRAGFFSHITISVKQPPKTSEQQFFLALPHSGEGWTASFDQTAGGVRVEITQGPAAQAKSSFLTWVRSFGIDPNSLTISYENGPGVR